MKKLLALLLALAMALSMVGTAWAEDDAGSVKVSNQTELNAAIADESATEVHLAAGEYIVDFYSDSSAHDSLTLVGAGAGTILHFANLQVRAALFDELTISNCTIGRMPNKTWGHLVFGSSTEDGGVYTISNCVFNGVGSQGIYINQNVDATFNIENCTFNGDFGGEGAVTIQNNGVELTVNVTDCAFNDIPEISHDIHVINPENVGLTLKFSYTVTFDANGGSGEFEQAPVPAGKYTLPACTFTAPEGKVFKAWSVGGTEYAAGDKITVNTAVTVTAVWKDEAPDFIDDAVVKSSETKITFIKEGYDKSDIASATDINTKLVVSEVSATDKEASVIKAAAKDAKVIGEYLDINIQVYVGDVYVGNISELPDGVTVVIPANMLPTFPSVNENYYTREYYVVRFHNGAAELLDAEMVEGGLAFKSDEFSTYAVAYEDVYTGGWGGYYPVADTTTETEKDDVTSPKTFDAGIAMSVAVSVLGTTGGAWLLRKKED